MAAGKFLDAWADAGEVTEILTLQDQFAILEQIGYLPEGVHAAWTPGAVAVL